MGSKPTAVIDFHKLYQQYCELFKRIDEHSKEEKCDRALDEVSSGVETWINAHHDENMILLSQPRKISACAVEKTDD